MNEYKEIERELITKYRKRIWRKFVKAICDYDMISDGDKIAVCISGGKDSMLMAKCFQELKRHGKKSFELVFLVMNPGYNEINMKKIEENAKFLDIPITVFNTTIFESAERLEVHPCYICARRRRGYLYEEAKKHNCNKIALGHHFDDVIETVLLGMFYGAQFQTMMPKLKSTSHPGMELIRPMYYIKEEDIIIWKNSYNLEFIACACRLTEALANPEGSDLTSKRYEVKCLIKELRKKYENIDINIMRSTENVNLRTLISYEDGKNKTHFLDTY